MVTHTLASRTSFDQKELKALQKTFHELAARQGNPNTITEDELKEGLAAVGIVESDGLLLHKIFTMMDTTEDGQVFFRDFVTCCSHMITGNIEEKLEFSFQLYASEDATIKKEDMVAVLKHSNSTASWFGDPCLDDAEVVSLCDDIFKEHGHESGTLKYADYMKAVAEHPILVQFISGKGQVKKEASITLEGASAEAKEAPAEQTEESTAEKTGAPEAAAAEPEPAAAAPAEGGSEEAAAKPAEGAEAQAEEAAKPTEGEAEQAATPAEGEAEAANATEGESA